MRLEEDSRERGGAGGRRPGTSGGRTPALREELAAAKSRPAGGSTPARGRRNPAAASASELERERDGLIQDIKDAACASGRSFRQGGGRRTPKTLLGQVEGLPSENAAVRRGELWNCMS